MEYQPVINMRKEHQRVRSAQKQRNFEERFAVVGTSERMLESMAVMGYVFSFQNFPVFGRLTSK